MFIYVSHIYIEYSLFFLIVVTSKINFYNIYSQGTEYIYIYIMNNGISVPDLEKKFIEQKIIYIYIYILIIGNFATCIKNNIVYHIYE